MSLLPEISQASAEINKLVAQANIHQTIAPVDPAAFTDPADTALLASRDPVIREVSVGMTGEAYSDYSVSGTPPLSLHNSLGKPLKAWSVEVSPYQEGTGDPSPSNVRAIHGTDKLTIYTALESDGQYKALEYIVIPNGACINTGFVSNSETLELRTKIQLNEYGQYYPAYGNYIDENTNCMRFIWGTRNTLFYANLNSRAGYPVPISFDSSLDASAVLTIEQHKQYVIINGTRYNPESITISGTANNTPIVIGTNKLGGNSVGVKRLYYFDISDNGVTLLQLRPALRVSDNVVGMYDLVSNTFLESATSTSCTAGTELSYYYPMHIETITLPQTVYTGTIGSEGGESRWGEVDLGTLTWSISGNYYVGVSLNDAKAPASINVAPNMLAEYADVIALSPMTASSEAIAMLSDKRLFTPRAMWQNTPIGKLVYELETPTQFAVTTPTIPTPTGTATTWATAEDGTVDSMEVTYIKSE